jgi:hypothetical protein
VKPRQADAWLCATLRECGVKFTRAWIAGGRVWISTADAATADDVAAKLGRTVGLCQPETKQFGKQCWITCAKLGGPDVVV